VLFRTILVTSGTAKSRWRYRWVFEWITVFSFLELVVRTVGFAIARGSLSRHDGIVSRHGGMLVCC
jgi:hypothetical protein